MQNMALLPTSYFKDWGCLDHRKQKALLNELDERVNEIGEKEGEKAKKAE